MMAITITTHAFASDWVSVDRAVSVSSPDPARFTQTVKQPNAAAWASRDNSMLLAIVAVQIPKGTKLYRNDLDEGFAKGLHGTLIDSSTIDLDGHTLCKMTAYGEMIGHRGTASQWIVVVNNTVYKLLVHSNQRDSRDDPDGCAFLQSLRISSSDANQYYIQNTTQTASLGLPALPSESAQRFGYYLGYYLGEGMAVFLALSIAYFAWKRLSRFA
jgi:hypothetical protein